MIMRECSYPPKPLSIKDGYPNTSLALMEHIHNLIVQQRRWDAVVALTSKPNIDVNLCGPDGMTPLLCAAGSGHRGVVRRLV